MHNIAYSRYICWVGESDQITQKRSSISNYKIYSNNGDDGWNRGQRGEHFVKTEDIFHIVDKAAEHYILQHNQHLFPIKNGECNMRDFIMIQLHFYTWAYLTHQCCVPKCKDILGLLRLEDSVRFDFKAFFFQFLMPCCASEGNLPIAIYDLFTPVFVSIFSKVSVIRFFSWRNLSNRSFNPCAMALFPVWQCQLII